MPRAFSIGNAIYRRPCGRYNARPTKNVNEDKPVLTLYDEKERGPVRNQTAYVFFAKTVTFVQSVKKLRQGFSHPILLSRADSAMYKDKLQIKA